MVDLFSVLSRVHYSLLLMRMLQPNQIFDFCNSLYFVLIEILPFLLSLVGVVS